MLLLALFLFSCTDTEEEKVRFTSAYKEILLVRETVTDSSEANSEVMKVMAKYGYDSQTFQKAYFEYAKKPEEFIIMLDSIRSSVQDEISKIEQSRIDTTEQIKKE